MPATGVVGQPVTVSVDPLDLWSPVLSSWDFGDGGSSSGATVEHCYSSPGEHTVTITGTDGAANSTSASRTITIEPDPDLAAGADPCAAPEPPANPEPPVNPGAPVNPGVPTNPSPPVNLGLPGNPGTTDSNGHLDPGRSSGPLAPVVSGLRQFSARWRTPGTRGRSRLPVGTTFRFQLSRPAQLRFAFSRLAPGRQAQARGTLLVAGEAGANVYDFKGKIRGHPLAPGHYRLRVTAVADGMTSAAASIRFTIVG